MKIRMQLISDVVFGNGESIPGGEDISILSDEHGFPYYKGGTFKGIFREEALTNFSRKFNFGRDIQVIMCYNYLENIQVMKV